MGIFLDEIVCTDPPVAFNVPNPLTKRYKENRLRNARISPRNHDNARKEVAHRDRPHSMELTTIITAAGSITLDEPQALHTRRRAKQPHRPRAKTVQERVAARSAPAEKRPQSPSARPVVWLLDRNRLPAVRC